MNCVIVDNNPVSRTATAELLSQVTGLSNVVECSDGMEAFIVLSNQKVDLLFVDIEMPGTSGFELIRNLASKCPVIIITTLRRESSVDALDIDVADYILKPVTPHRFIDSIEKAREIISYREASAPPEGRQFVFVRENGVLRKVMLDEIDYMEAMGDYVKIYTPSRFYIAHTKLRSIQQKLPSMRFLKVHRSFIIALNKIDKIEDGMIIINHKSIPVADGYRPILNSRLHIL
jgi:two-component system, LytTR family, response regulator